MEGRVEAPRDVLDAVVAAIRTVLGADVVAIWLYGSSVSGDFEPDVSDIDLIAVTARSIDAGDLPALESMHQRLVAEHVEWTDRIEVVYVARSTLQSFRTSNGKLAVISPGEPLHVRDEQAAEWLQNWYLVREIGRSLYGPEPVEVLSPIEWSEFAAATIRYAEQISGRNSAGSPKAIAYDILTMCRALRTIRLSKLSSKVEGARWTRVQLPEWRWLIDAALEWRRSGRTVALQDEAARRATRSFIDLMADEVQGASIPTTR